MKKTIKNKILLLNFELTDAKLRGDKKRVKELSEDIQFYINAYKNISEEDAKYNKQGNN